MGFLDEMNNMLASPTCEHRINSFNIEEKQFNKKAIEMERCPTCNLQCKRNYKSKHDLANRHFAA